MPNSPNSQQIQYLVQDWIQALRLLLDILEEYLEEYCEFIKLKEDKMDVLNDQNYQEPTDAWEYQTAQETKDVSNEQSDSEMNHDDSGQKEEKYLGMEFEVKRGNKKYHIEFRYDRSIWNLPHINLVVSEYFDRKKIALNVAIFWNQQRSKVSKRLKMLIRRMLKSDPTPYQRRSFIDFLNLNQKTLNKIRLNHAKFDKFELYRAYIKKMQEIENHEHVKLIQRLQRIVIKKGIYNQKDIQKGINQMINDYLKKVEKARLNAMIWFENLIKMIAMQIVLMKPRCINPNTKFRNNKDDDDNQRSKNEINKRIQRLNKISEIASKNKNRKDNHKKTEQSKYERKHKEYTYTDIIALEEMQAKLLAQREDLERMARNILDQRVDVQNIKKRKKFVTQLHRLSQEIINIVKYAGIAQTTAGGVGIASGLALIGTCLAPFTAGTSMALTAGGIFGGAASRVIKIRAETFKQNELRYILDDIQKQLQELTKSDKKLNQMMKQFNENLWRYSMEVQNCKNHYFIRANQHRSYFLLTLSGYLIKQWAVRLAAIIKITGLTLKGASIVNGAAILGGVINAVGNFTIASGLISIGVGTWDVLNGIQDIVMTPREATMVEKMAISIEQSIICIEANTNSMIEVAKQICQQ